MHRLLMTQRLCACIQFEINLNTDLFLIQVQSDTCIFYNIIATMEKYYLIKSLVIALFTTLYTGVQEMHRIRRFRGPSHFVPSHVICFV